MRYLTFFVLCLMLGACNLDFVSKPTLDGEGPVQTRQFDINGFTEIALAIDAEVKLQQGDYAVSASGQGNILDELQLETKGNKLKIDSDYRFRNAEPVVIEISIPTLSALAIGGSGHITAAGSFRDLDQVDIAIGGSGSLELEGESKAIEVSIGGSGNVFLRGNTGHTEISIGGSGEVDAYALQSQSCEVSIAGSGNVRVAVAESLDVSIAGSGDVHYRGNPTVTSSKVGSGEIIKE